MSLIDVNPVEAEAKLSLLRKYPNEIKDVILLACIVYLFTLVAKINDRLTNYLITDRTESLRIQSEGNVIMKDNNEVLHTVKNVLIVIKDLQDKVTNK